MKDDNSAFVDSPEPLPSPDSPEPLPDAEGAQPLPDADGPEGPLDIAALRADTPGCEMVIHFNNAGCGLMARPVLQAMLDHLHLEAAVGGYEPLHIDMHGARWVAPGYYRPVDTAARFEEWEFPYATVLGCAAAVRYALRVGPRAVARRTPALAGRLREQLAAVPGVRTLDRGPAPAALVTFAIEGRQAQPFKAALDARGVNSALSYREFAQYDIADKEVEWCLRLSPHYYNTEDEVDAVATAVAELAALPRSAR